MEKTDLRPLAEAEALSYPSLVCAVFDYCATGEGRTMGLLIISAYSVEDLRSAVADEWDEFYLRDVHVRAWSGAPEGFEMLLPQAIDGLLKQFNSAAPPMLRYATTLHFNRA